MKSIRALALASLTTVAGSLALHCHAETLSEIYQLALQNDHTYRAAKADYLANREIKYLNRVGLLPKLNAQATWDSTTTKNEPGESVIESVSGEREIENYVGSNP